MKHDRNNNYVNENFLKTLSETIIILSRSIKVKRFDKLKERDFME
jgi:hypothetical protein